MLDAAAPELKTARARAVAAAFRADQLDLAARAGDPRPPDRPARPQHPRLAPPRDVPRRRLGAREGRIALLHAVAHIEFNAIDLAFDAVARFADDPLLDAEDRTAFVRDWIAVGDDEARHFGMVRDRLIAYGANYGDLPAHDGLWSAAEATADSLLARLAIAPMVLEARGLDVTPGMAARLAAAGDEASAAVLQVIYREEIRHVAAGARWFAAACAAQDLEPVTTFHTLVRTRFPAGLKPPFNEEGRDAAGLARELYAPWCGANGSAQPPAE